MPERPGGRVPGVREGVVPTFDAFAVMFLELVAGHHDFSPDHEVVGCSRSQAERNRLDGLHLLGHVVAGLAVPPRGGLDEDAVVVDDLDGEPVELRFAGVRHLAVDLAADALVELPYRLGVARLGDRQHRHAVLHGVEVVERFAADALGGAVVGGEVEVLL